MGKYRINIKYNTEKDADVIQRLEAQENMQDYIRRLIRADIAADHLLGLQEDIEDRSYKERVRYWEEHCRASADPGLDDPCEGCQHAEYYNLGTDQRRCTLEAKWKEYKIFWENHCLAKVDPGIEFPCNECRYHTIYGCTLEKEWKETKGDGEI